MLLTENNIATELPFRPENMEKAHRHLLQVARPYPDMHRALKRNGRLKLRQDEFGDLFTFLCETLVSQQLSTRAADTIWSRVLELKSTHKRRSLRTLMVEEHRQALRECGISGRKVEALLRLSELFRRGKIDARGLRRASHEEVMETICALYGFGAWSAEMVSIFYAGQADVWSPGDVALVRGIKALLPEDTDHHAVVEACSPYRSYLALHVWRTLDEEILALNW